VRQAANGMRTWNNENEKKKVKKPESVNERAKRNRDVISPIRTVVKGHSREAVKMSPPQVRLLCTTWRFLIVFVNVRIERFIHTIDVDVFDYPPPAPLTAEGSTLVQLLR